jgi:pimeloyl-ACP methyl ester carboxylesterase
MKLVRKGKRIVLAGAVAALVGTSITAGQATFAFAAKHTPDQIPPKPTVVLVHGGFADATNSWSGVIKALQHDGYPVMAPANPLRSIPTDAAYVRSVLESIHGPVILVGHSYGGAVITNAAAGLSNVKALVYVAAFVPDVGEQLGQLIQKFPGSVIHRCSLAHHPLLGCGRQCRQGHPGSTREVGVQPCW